MENTKWYTENKWFGIALGYPECCVNEFCVLSPEVMARTRPTKDDQMKLTSGHIDNKFTGFIPCLNHAKQINNGEITLESLIKNRNPKYPSFPDLIT